MCLESSFQSLPQPAKVELSSLILYQKEQSQPDGKVPLVSRLELQPCPVTLGFPSLLRKQEKVKGKPCPPRLFQVLPHLPGPFGSIWNNPGASSLRQPPAGFPDTSSSQFFSSLPPALFGSLLGSFTLSTRAQGSVLDPPPLYLHSCVGECITS